MTVDPVDWPSIAADALSFPEAVAASRLVDELSAVSAPPDPGMRDDRARTAAARWIGEGRLDEGPETLGDTATSRFTRRAKRHGL